jgi:hypothetical protein
MVRRLTNVEARGLIRHPRILQKFYIYDPGVGDEVGGLRVLSDKDDKGNAKDGTKHVLAVQPQVQFFIDQGLMGEKPVGEISGAGKKFLAQVTRGRSEDNDTEPKRVARYSKRSMSGSPAFAGVPLLSQLRKQKAKGKKKAAAPKPSSPPPVPPRAPAPRS